MKSPPKKRHGKKPKDWRVRAHTLSVIGNGSAITHQFNGLSLRMLVFASWLRKTTATNPFDWSGSRQPLQCHVDLHCLRSYKRYYARTPLHISSETVANTLPLKIHHILKCSLPNLSSSITKNFRDLYFQGCSQRRNAL